MLLFPLSTTVTKVCDSRRCLTPSSFTLSWLFLFPCSLFMFSKTPSLFSFSIVLYEFLLQKCYWWLNTESKLNIYFFRLRKSGLGYSRWCMDPSCSSLLFFLQSVRHCQCWYCGGISCFFWATWRPLLVCCGMIATLQDLINPTKCRPLLLSGKRRGTEHYSLQNAEDGYELQLGRLQWMDVTLTSRDQQMF